MSLGDVKERFVWLDALRVSACFGVVALHIVAPLIPCLPFNSTGWWTSNIIMSLISSCVLIFVLISGALFLGRLYDASLLGFFMRRIHFVSQILFWTVFYIILRCISESDLTWRQLRGDLLRGAPYYHLWFLYMILGLYLVTPLLCWCVRKVSRSVRLFVLLCSLASICVVALAGGLFSCLPRQNIALLFVPFVPCFLLGYELFTVNVGRNMGKVCFGVYLLAAVFLSFVVYLCFSGHCEEGVVPWLSGSFSPFTIIMAVCFFNFFHAMKDARFTALIARLSPLTLGIYVLHPLFIRLLVSAGVPGSSVNAEFAVIMLVFVVFIWSAVTVWAIGKIPYIRRLVIARR